MKLGFIVQFVFVILFSFKSYAQLETEVDRDLASSTKVVSIEVKGNKKIEEQAVISKLVSKEGEVFQQSNIKKDVQNLFQTGFFYDVKVDRSAAKGGIKLTYILTEKPSVVSFIYNGNAEVDNEALAEANGLKSYEVLEYSKINTALEKMHALYEEKGFFLARITYKVVDLKDNKNGVRVEFNITEGDKVKVKQIRIIGNKNLTDDKLKTVMHTQEGGFFSFLSDSGAYQQDTFDQDMRILNYLYFNEGYVQVKIDRPQVYITPDKKSIYISIRIEEGEQFNVGEIDFAGDLLFSNDQLLDGTVLKESELFVSEKLQKDLKTIQAKYGDLGYAFANVIPRTRVKEKERVVDITYEIDKGNKVYIGKINVVGNTRTRDKVVRRELKIYEGELYNETRKRESESGVRRLGFFEEINFNTSTPNDRQDIMDIDVVVKERSTGQIQAGAGYSSYSKLVINGQVNQINFLGKGQNLGAALNYSSKETTFNLNFTEPYFNDTEWSVGYDLYFLGQERTEYEQKKKGAAVRVGHPLAEYLRGYIRYKIDDTEIDLNEDGDEQLYPADTVNGLTSSVTFSLQYDKRNDRFAPSDGVYTNLSLEIAGLGGDLDYTKGLATFRYYQTLFWDVVWRNNLTYGFINSNNSKDVPFNELFLLGGPNTLRGFQFYTVGKRKFSQKAFDALPASGLTNEEALKLAERPFGGEQQVYYNLEFQFPLIQEAGIKGVVFYDVGYADDSISIDDLKSDVGFGFRWFSPIGPLRFEWGFPIAPDKDFSEDDMFFQFAVGTPF